VSDGSAVLGLGNIGGKAAIPVMEGKAILFKGFGDIDAVPICLETQDTEEILMILKNIAPTFGGINLEDISAPRCFEIETRLQEMLDIPVFHDDQHGTAIVTAAALINGAKLVGKRLEELKVVINGAGAAGVAVATMLHNLGVQDILVCDRQGILSKNRDLPPGKRDVAQWTNRSGITGTLQEAARGRDVFIGVSGPKVIGEEEVRSMAKDPIIFAMSNPEPEITPELAYAGGAKVVGTGRSDYPNQINNVLVFPGLFRGALDGRAKRITREMKLAAAFALASYIPEAELRLDYVLPSPLDRQVAHVIAIAVKKAWEEKGTKDE
jgi:malate dehydrogenase (oxaloacetate-decarboxylating)